MNPCGVSHRRTRGLSRMKIRFLFEVCGTRTFFMTASCHQRAAWRGAAHDSHYDACRPSGLNMYAPRMAFQGTLIHFIKLASRSKSAIAPFPDRQCDFFQLINAPEINTHRKNKVFVGVKF